MQRAVRRGAVDVICVTPKGRTETPGRRPCEEERPLNFRKSTPSGRSRCPGPWRRGATSCSDPEHVPCLRRLEGGCHYDYIEVFDGPYHSSPLIARVCDSAVGSFTSSSNFMSVRFVSDSSVTRRGFQAEYYSRPSNDSTSKSSSGRGARPRWGRLGEPPTAQPPCGCGTRDGSSFVRSPKPDLVLQWVWRLCPEMRSRPRRGWWAVYWPDCSQR